MHLYRDTSILQRNVVSQSVVYVVHVVILGLQQERGRSLMGDRNIRIQPQLLIGSRRSMNHELLAALLCIPLRRGQRQVARINGHGKIGAAAHLVGGIDGGYKRFVKCVLIAATRCPPEENPSTPILRGSMCHSAA